VINEVPAASHGASRAGFRVVALAHLGSDPPVLEALPCTLLPRSAVRDVVPGAVAAALGPGDGPSKTVTSRPLTAGHLALPSRRRGDKY